MMMCVVYTMRAGVTLPMIKLSRISRNAIVGQASKRDGNAPSSQQKKCDASLPPKNGGHYTIPAVFCEKN
jgi:hypothetical protein